MQIPSVTSVSVLPFTVQTGVVVDARATTSPDEAVATSAGGAVPNVWLPGEANVMVCAVSGAAATLKVFEIGAADAKMLLPAWLALIVQLPAVSSVRVVPLVVQTPVVVDTNDTVRPEEAVATSAAGAVPSVWLPGETKVMLCAVSGAAATLKVCVTTMAPA